MQMIIRPCPDLHRTCKPAGALTGLMPTIVPTIAFTPAPTLPPLSQLNVQLISVSTVPGQITTRLRLFNGQPEAVRITPDTIWLALGYAPDPSGPRVSPEGLSPFDLLPGQAADLSLRWAWSGEPNASLKVGGYQYSVQLEQRKS